jgi:hypothetical protein
MGNNTEVVFEDIEQRILNEIGNAHYAIFVSVAWFTNKKLFNALLEKAKNNCYVSIIIQLDDINSQSGIDYNKIQIGRSECFKISKDAELLHDKFCVIDFKKVITGSYNWTYKASHNSENILILNDPSVATQYISRFEQQKDKFQELSIQKRSQTLPSSNIIVNTPPTSSSIQQNVIAKTSHSTKKCPLCKNEIGYNDIICQHCGKQQDNFHFLGVLCNGLKIQVICKKCSRKQEEALLDAVSTKFCTFCGSDKLEWQWSRKKK